MTSAMADPNEARLHRIADILGVTVDHFYGNDPPRKLADSAECVRLWDQLRTDEGRASVLKYLRRALADEGR